MHEIYIYTLYLLLFFVLELIYFRIARYYHIVDKPNHRSSHKKITLRGGGILFPMAVSTWYLQYHSLSYIIAGLLLISTISFIDDVKLLSNKLRSLIHFLAVALMICQINFSLSFYWYPLIFIVVVGIINAYNFMDGINGMTGLYSLVTFSAFLYINCYVVRFTDTVLIIVMIIALMVFNFFNLRKKAICFAGDVGSVSLAFIICFLMLALIKSTGRFEYVFLLTLYGIDTVITILIRLYNKENIFTAHRTHLYQLLVNEKGYSHLAISSGYALIQLVINALIIQSISYSGLLTYTAVIGIIFVYSVIRLYAGRKNVKIIA